MHTVMDSSVSSFRTSLSWQNLRTKQDMARSLKWSCKRCGSQVVRKASDSSRAKHCKKAQFCGSRLARCNSARLNASLICTHRCTAWEELLASRTTQV